MSQGFDKARFHAIVNGRSKSELQDMLIKIGPSAWRLATDCASTDENGDLLPTKDQPDDDVRNVFFITGRY